MRAIAAIVALLLASRAFAEDGKPIHLEVPVVQQARERCGPAALEMVLRFYGAGDSAVSHAARAYDPVLHGSLITDLADAARRAGFEATIVTLAPASLTESLAEGVPPIVLYQVGWPLSRPHYAVVTGWDTATATFWMNDGTAKPRTIGRAALARSWRKAGAQALIVKRRGS